MLFIRKPFQSGRVAKKNRSIRVEYEYSPYPSSQGSWWDDFWTWVAGWGIGALSKPQPARVTPPRVGGGYAGGGAGGCSFAAHTLIQMPSGIQSIDQIKQGDLVLAYQEYSGIIGVQPVLHEAFR